MEQLQRIPEEAAALRGFGASSPGKLMVRKLSTDFEMDITPMIDMTFLLLIFFLVASKMDRSVEVKLPPARHATAVATRDAVIVTIDAAPGGGAGAGGAGSGGVGAEDRAALPVGGPGAAG